jgi:hypothetical protein
MLNVKIITSFCVGQPNIVVIMWYAYNICNYSKYLVGYFKAN